MPDLQFSRSRAADRRAGAGGVRVHPALYAAREGRRPVRQAGVGAIRDKSLRQTARAIALAERRGFRKATPADPARRGGTASIDLPKALEVSRS